MLWGRPVACGGLSQGAEEEPLADARGSVLLVESRS